MLVADTNILLRLMLQDDAQQSTRVSQFLAAAERKGSKVYVPQVVLQECLWVLQAVYGLPRERIVEQVDGLLNMSVLQLEEAARIRRALHFFSSHSIDFVDAYIAGVSEQAGFSGALSFDKDLGKLGIHGVRP